MSQPHLCPAVHIVKGDEAACLGLLDRHGIGDAREQPNVHRLADCQDVDYVADRRG